MEIAQTLGMLLIVYRPQVARSLGAAAGLEWQCAFFSLLPSLKRQRFYGDGAHWRTSVAIWNLPFESSSARMRRSVPSLAMVRTWPDS